jgi:hypothetical protein
MKNYIILTINNTHFIKETPTEHVIKKFKNIKNAKTFCNKLNRGMGFDGYTPDFLFKRFVVK